MYSLKMGPSDRQVQIHKTYIWSDGPETQYHVYGLQTSHIYQFRVYAQNEAGRGEALLNKNLIRIKAATKKPPSPSKPQTDIQDDESVLLTWTISEGFSDVNFIVERYESKSDLWMQCNHGLLARASYLVTDLFSGKEYIFRVSCENAHGVGLPSEESDPVVLKACEREAPIVTVPVTDCFVKVDGTASFSCGYTGTQPILVNWSKDGIRIREGLGASVATETNKSTLQLEEVDSDDDECSVQCDLRNSEGKVSSKAKIKMLSWPKINCPSSYKDGLTYDEGDNLRLKAAFAGKPTPIVKWFFNDREPTLDDRIEVSVGPESIEVRINDLRQSDEGTYKFAAENTMGEDSLTVHVMITGPPSPPSGPSIELIGGEVAILKWDIPRQDGGSDVYNYIVEIRKLEDKEWQSFSTVHDTFLQITDRAVLEESVFRVRAVNIYGTSEPSEESHLKISVSNDNQDLSCTEDFSQDTDSKKNIGENTIKVENFKGLELFNTQNHSNEAELLSSESSPNVMDWLPIPTEPLEEQQNGGNISVSELDYMIEPLKVMYVATQTLISMPILNHACSDVHDFDEITHFAAEVMPQEEFLIQVIDNIFSYVVCWVPTVLENPLQETFKNVNLISKCECSWVFNECSLQKFEPICYDSSEEYHLKIMKHYVHFVENCFSVVDVTEQIFYYSADNKPLCSLCSIEVQFNFLEAIFVWLHPWIIECFLPVIAYVASEKCSVSYELLVSAEVYEATVFYSTDVIDIKDVIVRSSSITHIPEEFETLAGLKCVLMTAYKPALSVLPMSRSAHSEIRRKDVQNDFITDNGLERENLSSNILSRLSSVAVSYDLDDKFLITSPDVCPKCASPNLCLCTFIEETSNSFYLPGSNNIEVNLEHSANNEYNKTRVKTRTHSIGDINVTGNVPDWLRFVSPCFASGKETVEENTDHDDKLVGKEIAVRTEVGNSYLKDKSVQELLSLAEEVERSFSQKAEQIESLENILQEELSSLEKDLEAVHEIHRSFWNESHAAWMASDPCNEPFMDSSVYDVDSLIEKDLTDFKKDVPFVKSEKKQEEYSPEVVTHLQNRVVQCGCRTRLYCSISGKPDPQIAWLKNGRLLSQSSRYVCSNLVEFGLYIDIFNAKSTDSGAYMCIATNCHGSAQTEAYLRVVGHREYSPEEPRFLKSPDDVSIPVGQSVTLEWKISGTPFPHVVWFKNAEKIETNLRIDTFSNHRGCCRLVLHNVTQDDSAIYSCYLENEAGSSVSTVLVSVAEGTETFPASFQVDLAQTIMPSLTEDSYIPSLQYYERLVQRSIPSMEPSKKAKLPRKSTCKDTPGPPFTPHIMNFGKSWAILSWSAPTNRTGQKGGLVYRLEKRLLNSEVWKEVGHTRNNLYTVSRLKSGQSYVFRISAGNDDGWGPAVLLTQPFHCGTITSNDQIY